MAQDKINDLYEMKTELFRGMAEQLRGWALKVRGDIAIELDDATYVCECCGTQRYRNFTQKQLRDRVIGVAERMEEIASVLERRARDPGFHVNGPQPSVKARAAGTLTAPHEPQ